MPNAYLCRQTCGYCFRMRVPKDLQAAVGKKEIKYSLKEGSLRTVKSKAKMVAGQVTDLFNNLKKHGTNMATLTRIEINNLIAEYIKQSIADAEDISVIMSGG